MQMFKYPILDTKLVNRKLRILDATRCFYIADKKCYILLCCVEIYKMRSLLDNSTLTSAFRAIGLIKNTSRELFELDLSALRLFIDTILLSNEIIIVDNYKFQSGRN